MQPQIRRALGIALAITNCLTAACVPMSSTYERIDAPDAVYFKNSCRGTVGPPSTVYFPYHGIYISLNFDYTTFGLHIPEGLTVLLKDNTVKVDGVSKSGAVQKTVHIKVFRQGAAGAIDPPAFSVSAPYTSPDSLGPFEGRSVGNRYVYYFFMGVNNERPDRTVSLPIDMLDGTIELPAMTINGQLYERQTLPFKQTSYFEISPVNC